MLQQLVMKIVLWGTAAISGLYALLWAARALALLVVWAVALALIIVAVIAAITIPTLPRAGSGTPSRAHTRPRPTSTRSWGPRAPSWDGRPFRSARRGHGRTVSS